MNNIKISEKDKQILNRYNHFLMAVVGDDGIYAQAHVSEYDGVDDFYELHSSGGHELDTKSEGYKLLTDLFVKLDSFYLMSYSNIKPQSKSRIRSGSGSGSGSGSRSKLRVKHKVNI